MFDSVSDVPQEAAEAAGLRYVSDARPGIRRRNSRTGFAYTRADDAKLTGADGLRLGNTPTICRKCYVHPELVTSYLDGKFVLKVNSQNKLRDDFSGLKSEEAAVLAMLRSRLGHEISRDHQLSSKTRQTANTA